MTDFNYTATINAVVAMRNSVALNHDRCKTAFARGLHVRLLGKLDEMATDLMHDVEWLAELRRQLRAPEICEGDFNLVTCRMNFEYTWIDGGPISLLDEIQLLVRAEGEHQAALITIDYNVVSAAEQEGLAELCEQFRRQTGVKVVAARR